MADQDEGSAPSAGLGSDRRNSETGGVKQHRAQTPCTEASKRKRPTRMRSARYFENDRDSHRCAVTAVDLSALAEEICRSAESSNLDDEAASSVRCFRKLGNITAKIMLMASGRKFFWGSGYVSWRTGGGMLLPPSFKHQRPA